MTEEHMSLPIIDISSLAVNHSNDNRKQIIASQIIEHVAIGVSST